MSKTVRIVMTGVVASLAGVALCVPANASTVPKVGVAVPVQQVRSAPAELAALDASWQELSVDAFGNRQAGDWTIAPDGSRTMAAASAADCYSGQTCLFQDGNFGGWIRVFTAVQLTNLASPYNDAMSSWINLNSRGAAWYPNASGGGTQHCMPSGYQVSQVLAGENDTASSVRVINGVCS